MSDDRNDPWVSQRVLHPNFAEIIKLTSTLVMSVAAGCFFSTARAQSVVDPNPAANHPDKFAWDLFMEINRPALAGQRGVPDPSKKIGDPGLRVWETWKITTPIGSEVFLEGGKKPAPWDQPQVLEKGQVRKFLSPRKFAFTRLDRRRRLKPVCRPDSTLRRSRKVIFTV
jgi:hypothetical protein